MSPFEIRDALDGMVVLVDTREQDTPRLRARLREFGKTERDKLDFGDYSVKFPLPDNQWLNLQSMVAVERKMSLDEICGCFTGRGHLSDKQLKERNMEKCLCPRCRFKREFERAKEKNAKMYLLIENADWEKCYKGQYRSQMNSNAFVASLLAWLSRYNCQLVMCREQTGGRLIRDILYREGKEILEGDKNGLYGKIQGDMHT